MKKVRATEYVEMMFQGRSRSQLVLASDGNKYVVKMIGNPQGSRILANECVTAGLAEALGAPSVPGAIVEVDESVMAQIDRKVKHILPSEHLAFKPGLQFGSLYLGVGWPFPSEGPLQVLPSTLRLMAGAGNVSSWPNSIVLNALAQNEDPRHEHVLVVVDKVSGGSGYWLIDHGHCLAVDRGWQTLTVNAIKLREPLYPELVKGGDPFGDPLERLEAMTAASLHELVASCPAAEWGVSQEDQDALVKYIIAAKARLPRILMESRRRFPSWT